MLHSLMALWGLAGALFMYEETSRRFKLMHDHLSAETHQKYMAITARMIRVKMAAPG